MKQIFILLFLCTIILNAQYKWSEPVELSGATQDPECYYKCPSIAMSTDGTLYGFWLADYRIDLVSYYTHILYRSSTDGGNTWSETDSLLTDNITKQFFVIKAIGDSKNRIHLFYIYNQRIYHRILSSGIWSDPYEIYYASDQVINVEINQDDQIFITWPVGYNIFYSYCDVSEVKFTWSPPSSVTSEDMYFVKDIKYDSTNNIHGVGVQYTDSLHIPYYFYFDNLIKDWTKITPFELDLNGDVDANAIAISNKDSLYITLSKSDYLNNLNYLVYRNANGDSWSVPTHLNKDNFITGKSFFCDNDNNLHLFERHYISTIENKMNQNKDNLKSWWYSSIIHSMRKNGIWTVDTLLCDPDSLVAYEFYDEILYDKNDMLYFIYLKENHIDPYEQTVQFMKKQIEVGIEEDNTAKSTALIGNYPNPFNSSTTINFSLSNDALVELNVFNIKGELVKNLISKKVQKGNSSIIFKAENFNSGLYFYQMLIEGNVIGTKQMLYLK